VTRKLGILVSCKKNERGKQKGGLHQKVMRPKKSNPARTVPLKQTMVGAFK
jgi:hypothetical protein